MTARRADEHEAEQAFDRASAVYVGDDRARGRTGRFECSSSRRPLDRPWLSSPSMRTLLFVAAGGAAGSAARYLIGTWMKNLGTIPWGTMVVNLAGSFILGVVVGALSNRSTLDGDLRTAITVGVLGGFTTFSTWTVESVELFGSGRIALATMNVFAALVGGLIAAALGIALGRAT